MVAVKAFVPLVRFHGGDTVAFDARWLLLAIEQAVNRAGGHPWPFAHEFVTGIALYMRHCCLKTVIDLPELELAVRRSLQDVGHGELATHFRSHGFSYQTTS